MSFFGFDPTGRPSKEDLETYDFEETYEGLGEHPEEADDALNSETFGDDVYVGKDFDFGGGAEPSAVPAKAPPKQTFSYARAAAQPVDEILQPMASLWGSSDAANLEQHQQQQQQPQPSAPAPKVLSLEEIEAQLLGGEPVPQQAPQQHQMFGPPPGAFQNFMLPPGPGGFPPPQFFNNQPLPFPPPHMGGLPQFQHPLPGDQHQQHPQPPLAQPGQAPLPPPQSQQQVQQQPAQQAASTSQQDPVTNQQPPPQQQPRGYNSQPRPPASSQSQRKQDLSQFPVLGSTEAETASQVPHQGGEFQNGHQQQQQQQQRQQQQFQQRSGPHQQQQQYQQQHHQHFQRPQYNMYNVNNPELTPEERERLIRRKEKVDRISRYSGIMNPRDKDYITRFQLSQIVSEDPYNEDFYYQVFKVLKNQGTNHIDGMSSIAQNYLDQSGHRLGGKHKRADIALQRMQQQVAKAVTTAKERGPKRGILTREGALGKVSYNTIKKPRTTLVIKAQEGDIEINADEVPHPPSESKISKSSKKFHLFLIEKLYGITLRYESMERENIEIDNSELMETIFSRDGSGDESFVYIFNYDKGMKLFPRFFRFLSYEQKLNLITFIFKNLQKIDIISKSSYKNYEDSILPLDVTKKINTFQTDVLKNLVLFLSEAKFSEVLNLLVVVLTQNNLLFLSTTKIGLSFITISISRLELIKQEYNNNVSATELTTWSDIYDSLFQQLEGKLTEIFPTSLSSAKPKANESNEDDSYIWQFLASLSLAGKLSHQRVIVDEIRDEIFGVQAKAKSDIAVGNYERANKSIGNLNLFLNVMGLKANEDDISELN